MVSVMMHTTGVEDLRSTMRKAAEGWPIVQHRIAEDAVKLIKQTATTEIQAEHLIATGSLLNTLKSEIRTAGSGAEKNVTGSVTTNLVQGIVADVGRQTGEYAGRGLMKWVILKLGTGNLLTARGKARKEGSGDLGSARYAASSLAELAASRLTYVISRSLKDKGLKPRPWADKAGQAAQLGMPAIAERCLDEYQRSLGF